MTHKTIYEALLAIQAEMTEPAKEAENPHFKSAYVDLASLKRHLRPLLNKHGVLLYHTLRTSGSDLILDTTARISASDMDKCVSSSMPIVADKPTPQALGSAITYATRYTTMALFGISGDDDDGEAASKPVQKPATKPATTQPAAAKEVLDPYDSVEVAKAHIEQCKTVEQLGRVGMRLKVSTKLTPYDKNELRAAYEAKDKELKQ